MKRTPRRIALSLFSLSLMGSVGAETLTVFAASSLKESFEAIAARYERANPGDKVELNFAGSQILRRQIQQGAAADVFASADQSIMDDLKRLGLVAEDKVFARNRLVMAASKEGKVASLRDAARPGVKVVVAEATAPAGRYTAQVLEEMDEDGSYGPDYKTRVEANTVSREANVRGVLMKIILGEADAGFVYATDAAGARGKIRLMALPDGVNPIAAYPIAVLAKSASPEKARKFVGLVLGEEGQSLLKERGFLPAAGAGRSVTPTTK
jgi:molybdate transport system substrate-binding protein